jgi:chromosomal replication initiator protein DnaA
VNSVLQSRVHRSDVWRRLFGSSPKISTTVENIVENAGLYLSSKKSLCFSGFSALCGSKQPSLRGFLDCQADTSCGRALSFRQAKVFLTILYRADVMEATIWDQVLARIETKVNRHSFYTWFRPTALLSDGGEALTIRVPNPLFKDWLTKHYSVVLSEALAEVRPGTGLIFVSEGSAPTAAADEAPVEAESLPIDAPTASSGGLNPRYTFDTFIVGSSNQFAHAASRAVAEAPSRSYNPLFIYGGVGLGKTHLMHAVGHYVLQHDPTLKLTYISSERFMNEMINAVRYDRILDFRERYRSVDVLLVDDIQFVAGKEGTQTEFFHTFNALYDAQKQIVLSSDRPPNEIPALEERLRSRFEWGLTADIQSPDLETKSRFSNERPRPKPCRCPTTWQSTSPAGSNRIFANSKDP